MKKLILTILIILVTGTNINALSNNSLKFTGYSSKYRSTILEDADGVALVINDIYNIYELFIPILEDYSIVLNSKEELFYYYNLYKNNKDHKDIEKIEANKNYYDIYFNFLGGKYYRVDKKYFNNLMITYINNISYNKRRLETFFFICKNITNIPINKTYIIYGTQKHKYIKN